MSPIKINFDLDGTLADLYGIPNWLDELRNENPMPYISAKPMVNMSLLARYIHKLQKAGIEICVISWTSKNASEQYHNEIDLAKREWLQKHLPSVTFDRITIVPYGSQKSAYTENPLADILFDDNAEMRNEWKGSAYEPNEIFSVMKALLLEVAENV